MDLKKSSLKRQEIEKYKRRSRDQEQRKRSSIRKRR